MKTKVLVAGHTGMVGRAVIRTLNEHPHLYDVLIAPDRNSLRHDYLDQLATARAMEDLRPDCVVICAAKVGGILDNMQRPVEFLADNAAIQWNIIRAANLCGVGKLIALGSSCIYPRHCPQPMQEDMLLTGSFEPTNQAYAIAKVAGIELCRSYRNQYGKNFYALMPPNLYGPYDNFTEGKSHAVAALLRKAYDALPRADFTVWGTGKARREFMHVDDLASAIEFCIANVNAEDTGKAGFINSGSGEDCTIGKLAEMICDVSGKGLVVDYDASKPDGMPSKMMDSSRIKALGWSGKIGLREGLERTWNWMEENYEQNYVRK